MDIGIQMGWEALEDELEERENPRRSEVTWSLTRLPKLDDPGVNRLFVSVGGAWQGYFVIKNEVLWNPEDPRCPYALIFDTTTWGWLAMIMGVVLFLVGLGLTGGAGWARWVAIILLVVNLLGNIGWVGSSQYPIWALTVVALEIIVLYALTARWSGRMLHEVIMACQGLGRQPGLAPPGSR